MIGGQGINVNSTRNSMDSDFSSTDCYLSWHLVITRYCHEKLRATTLWPVSGHWPMPEPVPCVCCTILLCRFLIGHPVTMPGSDWSDCHTRHRTPWGASSVQRRRGRRWFGREPSFPTIKKTQQWLYNSTDSTTTMAPSLTDKMKPHVISTQQHILSNFEVEATDCIRARQLSELCFRFSYKPPLCTFSLWIHVQNSIIQYHLSTNFTSNSSDHWPPWLCFLHSKV